jgi:hypothetical protein
LCSTRASFGNTQADVSDRDKLTYLKYNGTHYGSEQFNSTARVFTPLFTTLKSFLLWAALAPHIYPKMLWLLSSSGVNIQKSYRKMFLRGFVNSVLRPMSQKVNKERRKEEGSDCWEDLRLHFVNFTTNFSKQLCPRVGAIKLFASSFTAWQNKLECLTYLSLL